MNRQLSRFALSLGALLCLLSACAGSASPGFGKWDFRHAKLGGVQFNLGAPGLDSSIFVTGVASSGSIFGATPTSTIVATGLPAGLTINGAARTWAWDGTGSVSSGSFTLTETLAGYANSPRANSIGYSIISSVAYDTSIGNGVDSAGFAILPLRSGAHRYYVNSSTGNDANDCTTSQSSAAPKATLGGAFTCVTAGSGDQILIAEGTTYTEDWGTQTASYPTHDGGTWVAFKAGFSLTYPTVVQSYDPADPLNESKYGHAYQRGAWPVFTGFQTQNSNGSWGFFAVRGIEFNTATENFFGFEGTAPGILIEGCRFHETQVTIDSTLSTPGGDVSALPHHLIFRNNVWWEPWDTQKITNPAGYTGRVGALLILAYADVTWEDNFVYHNGWPISGTFSTRADNDIAQTQTHPVYDAPTNTNFIGRRNLIIDPSADGGGMRGDGLLTENVVIGAPGGLGMGPPSTETGDRPNGLLLESSFNLILAGPNFNTTTPEGGGFSSDTGLPGSRTHHNLIIHAAGNKQEPVFSNVAYTGVTTRSYMENDNNLSFDWDVSGFTHYDGGGPTPAFAVPFTVYDNNAWDDPASGTNINSGTLTFPNPYSEAQLYVASGYADKNALVNAMIANPVLHAQRTILVTAFAGYGRTLAAATDQVKPILSSPTSSSPSAGVFNIGFTTNKSGGKWYALLSTSSTPPLPAQVRMGVNADHSAAVNLASGSVTSSGVQAGSFSSVSGGTYFAYIIHKDSQGNKSDTLTTSAVTVAGAATTWDPANSSTDWSFSPDKLAVTRTSTGTGFWAIARATSAKVNGTYIVTVNALDGGSFPAYIGFDVGGETQNLGHDGNGDSIGWRPSGDVFFDAGVAATFASYTAGDVLKLVKAGTNISFYKNNVLQGTLDVNSMQGSTTTLSGAAFPAISNGNGTGTQVTADFSLW